MKKLMALFIILAVGVAAPAQTPAPQKPQTARFGDPTNTARYLQGLFYGVIKSLDKSELVLEKTKFGVDQSVKLDEKTKFVHDGKPSSLDNLKVGDQVWLQVKTNKKTGEMTARKVLTGVVAPTIRK